MAKAQILIVEDDSIVVMELQDRLQSLGYAVAAGLGFGGFFILKFQIFFILFAFHKSILDRFGKVPYDDIN